MKTICNRFGKVVAVAGTLFTLFAASGSALADSYNIIFKNRSGQLACASGGFTFTKGAVGAFPTSGASATFQPACLSPALLNGTYTPGGLNVVVQNVVLNNKPGTGGQNESLNQGPNVVGLSGTLQYTTTNPGDCGASSSNTAPKTYTITFAYGGSPVAGNRTYVITCSGPGTPLAATTGLYHVVNTLQTVPEPETLWLALVGLSALVLSRRIRRRS